MPLSLEMPAPVRIDDPGGQEILMHGGNLALC